MLDTTATQLARLALGAFLCAALGAPSLAWAQDAGSPVDAGAAKSADAGAPADAGASADAGAAPKAVLAPLPPHLADKQREAVGLLRQSKFVEAEPLAREMAQEAPTHPEAVFLLVEVLERQGRYDDALLELVNAAARPEVGSQFVLRLADAYERAKQHDKTRATLDEAVRRYPDDPEVYAKLGLVTSSSDPAKAEEAYKKAISLEPNHQLSLNNLGALYISQARYQDAYAVFQKALSRDPNSLSTNFNMGQVELALGRNADAIVRFEKILTRRPGDPLAWSNLALGHIQDGKTTEALAKLQPLLEAPEPQDVVSYAQGLAYLFDGKPAEASKPLATSYQKSGGRVFQALAYAELLRQENKLDEAEKVLAKLQKGSASAKSFSLPYLALLRHSQGRTQEAAALRDEALKAQPDAKTPDDLRTLLRMPPKAIADLKAIPPTQAPAATPDAGPAPSDAGAPKPAAPSSGCACALPQRGEAPTSPSPAWLLLGLLVLRRRR